MAGPDRADPNSGDGGLIRVLSGNRLIAVLLAILAGGSSGVIGIKVFPPSEESVRPNAWTSIQASEANDKLRALMVQEDEKLRALVYRRVSKLRSELNMALKDGVDEQKKLVKDLHLHELWGARADNRISRIEKAVDKCEAAIIGDGVHQKQKRERKRNQGEMLKQALPMIRTREF